ncbi:MAG: malate dehydrogenase [delta proteobacterium ML8_F1]|nr:MAG: malate dehydrogenase [delta proteobacterium ML8_F1]
MDYYKESLLLHEKLRGKIEVKSKLPINTMEDLSLGYTPGVAAVCTAIAEEESKIYDLTMKGNTVAVVTDGSAVLGLGDIGPKGALPVMEGKALLFKEFGGVDAFPILIDSKDVEEIVRTVEMIAPGFGGINLEDISAPRCFEIERRLKKSLDIPVFHDDQHGTAIVVLAGLINGMKLMGRALEDMRVVINGAGSAGTAIANLLNSVGVGEIVVCDRKGAIYEGRDGLNPYKEELSLSTNPGKEQGNLREVLVGKDIFIGVSQGNLLKAEDISRMNPDPIIFALANPSPEIDPSEAMKGGALVVGTGRSDYPNQVNNVLVFPGMFRGALDARVRDITQAMKIAAAEGIAHTIGDSEISREYILPKAFDERVLKNVSEAVMAACRK